jgi:hypothetical protein
VFDPAEALLFGGRDELPVDNDRRSGIGVMGVNA